jgi:PAS domain S-box-containing protein
VSTARAIATQNRKGPRRRAGLAACAALPVWLSFAACVALPVWLGLATSGASRAAGPQAASSSTHSDAGLPTLTQIAQIRQLSADQAIRGYPVRVTAVVTYYTAGGPRLLPGEFYTAAQPDMFIQDATAGIWVHVPPGGPTAAPGELIEVEGITENLDFGQQITQERWKVVGQAPLPAPHRVSFDRLASAAEDGQRVEVDGIVRSVEEQDRFHLVEIAVGAGRLRAVIPADGESTPERLIDAEVRVRGVSGALFNTKNQMIGVLLYVPSWREFQVTRPAPPDPFAVPAQPLSSLQQFTPGGFSGHRIHVQSVVSLEEPGNYLYVSEGTNGLRVETDQPTSFLAGDQVDVLGFADVADLRLVLKNATVRLIRHGPKPVPVAVTGRQLLHGEYDSALVSIEARLLEKSLAPGKQTLVLESDGFIYEAIMESEQPDPGLEALLAGSRLRLTAICTSEKDKNGRNQSFHLLFDEARDIATIQQASFWTLRRALGALGAMVLAILAAAAWALLLKRRVNQQTDAIRQAYEREASLQEQYAQAQRLAHTGSWEHEIPTHKSTWSEETFRILGYAPGEVPADRELLLSRVHPADREKVRQSIGDARKTASGNSEFRIVRPDGEERLIAGTGRVLFDEEGKPLRAYGALQDITERKRVEKSLEERTAYLDALIENSPIAITVVDAENRVRTCNPAFERLFQYSPEAIAGVDLNELIVPAELAGEAKDLYQKIETDAEVLQVTTRRRRKDGTLVDVDVYGVPLQVHGEVVGIYRLYVDITERMKAEREFQKALEATEAANRAKSQFVANMSHEIRTPITGVLGMLDLALDGELNPEQREYLVMAEASAQTLLSLITDILDFSKIEVGKLDLESIEFNLRASMEETLKPMAVRADAKGLELNCDVEGSLPEVLVGDPSRLRQILVNLVGNAIKFTESGEVTVRVEAESETAESVELHFTVADTGIGIPAEKQAAVFDAFTQADGSTARRYGGTGLGLTICRRLVDMMGGRLWVDSRLGQGSVFHFSVRLGVASRARRTPPLEAARLEELPVLVVDDNATNRRILEDTLASWRMKPSSVEAVPAALDQLRQAIDSGRPFPLVLLDAHMPEMDGFSMVEKLREDPKLADTLIIMLTSAGQRGDGARCRELGVAAYLNKPIGRSELLSAILRVMQAGVPERTPSPLVTRHSLREETRLRILLAEDNAVNQTLAVRLLTRFGCEVMVANNGGQALEKLKEDRFDLVLMDVQMPEMDGYEATAAVRDLERTTGAHIPIIAVTAHAMKGDRERCLEAGMDGYIAKPIRVEELLSEIKKLTQHFSVPVAAS